MKVMPAELTGFAVTVVAGGGKDPLPAPFAAGVRVLLRECVRQLDPTGASGEVQIMELARGFDVRGEGGLDCCGKHGTAIPAALALAHDDLVTREVDVLHTEAAAFEQSDARAVAHLSHRRGRC